eukprot:CAMPEP_0174885640 /NCGR_PEP_ID=MMETSP0167-20121228/894_1 /TAXON_ID=38298 /ORGANISM="Rhodella maculata, Strain CCMP736" /LENGTH=91 /DNA_ID=CAMNT_0016121281 /DNA_START=188 /DNA_END=460 /DNA_ORIENTATION=+
MHAPLSAPVHHITHPQGQRCPTGAACSRHVGNVDVPGLSEGEPSVRVHYSGVRDEATTRGGRGTADAVGGGVGGAEQVKRVEPNDERDVWT